MSKSPYYVTDVQGARPDIAGKRRKVGERITLTQTEAEFEVSRGTIITQEEHERLQAEAAKASETPATAPKSGKVQ